MKFKTIAIIGLGLMGGSLAAACRKKFPHAKIIGVSRAQDAIQSCLKKKWIHSGTSDLQAGVADADLIVICTPVDTFIKTMIVLDKVAKQDAMVTDVGSVKGLMQNWLRKSRLKKIHFVGAHPMVGSHERGVQAARPDLYEKGLVLITPSKLTSNQAFETVQMFWKKLCQRVVVITAEQHDRTVAQISHLPHLLAACLVESVPHKSLHFAGAGFKDTTRIAEGHPSVWLPIFMANNGEVIQSVKAFEIHLKRFKTALINNDHKTLFSILQHASKTRSEISL